jgi:hypothetical protein
MGTARELRKAGAAAVVTAVLLTLALVAVRGGPASEHPNGVLAWHAQNAGMVKAAAVLWLLAMLGLVVFAVKLREAIWAASPDRSWVTVLFLQGASVFATVAVIAAAVGWSLGHQADAGTISAELAATMWSLEQTLLRFATWGFTAPIAVVALALYRHSLLGQLCAAAAILLAIALLVPLTWAIALYAFPAWLLLVAITLFVPAQRRALLPPGEDDPASGKRALRRKKAARGKDASNRGVSDWDISDLDTSD